MFRAERQQSWGWVIAIYVFLAGVGGGTFLFSFVLAVIGMYKPVARVGALIGPLLVLFGTFFLLIDLGSITRAYRLFTTVSALLTSWMARGAWILAAFIICGLAYALPSFELFNWLPWTQTSGLGQGIGIAAALLSILVVVYPGFLLGVIKSIPLWNTPALPLLFFLSGSDNGIGVLAIVSLSFPVSLDTASFHLIGTVELVLILLLMIVLGAYFDIVSQSGVTASASVQLLKTPMFIGGVIILGLIVPFGLSILSLFVSDALAIRTLGGITGTFVLVGGLLLRYGVIRAGVRVSVR